VFRFPSGLRFKVTFKFQGLIFDCLVWVRPPQRHLYARASECSSDRASQRSHSGRSGLRWRKVINLIASILLRRSSGSGAALEPQTRPQDHSQSDRSASRRYVAGEEFE